MLRFAPMIEVNIVVLKQDVDRLIRELVSLGFVQFFDGARLIKQEYPFQKEAVGFELDKIYHLKERLMSFSIKVGIDLNTYVPPATVSFLQMEKQILAWDKEAVGLFMKREELLKKINHVKELAKGLRMLPSLEFSAPKRYSYIDIRAYQANKSDWELIKSHLLSFAHLVYPYYDDGKSMRFVIVLLKKDVSQAKSIVEQFSLEELSDVDYGRLRPDEKDMDSGLNEELININKKIESLKESSSKLALSLWRRLSQREVFLRAKEYFSRTDYVYIVYGWIPSKNRNALEKKLVSVCGDKVFLHTESPSEIKAVKEGKIKVPVMFQNNSVFSPFESLVKMYGVPDYGMLDPTIMVAFLFVVMFGAMFGDFGQGIVLILLGVFFLRAKKEMLRKSGIILTFAGSSAAFFGLLYGSVFGFENIIPPLWISPMHKITTLFKVSVLFGVAVISAGVIINFINNLRKKDYQKLVFDKAGILSGIVYWALLGILAKKMFGIQFIFIPLLSFLAGVGVLAFILEKPILSVLKKGEKKESSIFSYFFEKIIEVFEIILGFFTNTLSFIRVGAFSLAHIGLFIAIFGMADIIKNASGNDLYSIAVVGLGNISVIFLEGIIVAIQVLRLQYYEFFSRFFSGQGEEFKPLKI